MLKELFCEIGINIGDNKRKQKAYFMCIFITSRAAGISSIKSLINTNKVFEYNAQNVNTFNAT